MLLQVRLEQDLFLSSASQNYFKVPKAIITSLQMLSVVIKYVFERRITIIINS